MELIKTIIIDDEYNPRELIQTFIKTEQNKGNLKLIKIVGEADSIYTAQQLIIKHQPQLILLDIQLPPFTGFQLIERLKHLDFKVIFITAYQRYALRAIKISAIDFIVKPINHSELITAIKKAITNIKKENDAEKYHALVQHLADPTNTKNRINIPLINHKGIKSVRIIDIIYCEAFDGLVKIWLKDGTYILSPKSLKYFTEAFESYQCFFRCHHAYLVNLYYISRSQQLVEKDKKNYVIIDNDSIETSTIKNNNQCFSLPVSRRKLKKFILVYNSFQLRL